MSSFLFVSYFTNSAEKSGLNRAWVSPCDPGAFFWVAPVCRFPRNRGPFGKQNDGMFARRACGGPVPFGSFFPYPAYWARCPGELKKNFAPPGGNDPRCGAPQASKPAAWADRGCGPGGRACVGDAGRGPDAGSPGGRARPGSGATASGAGATVRMTGLDGVVQGAGMSGADFGPPAARFRMNRIGIRYDIAARAARERAMRRSRAGGGTCSRGVVMTLYRRSP